MSKRRTFTPEFKLQCVLDIISGRKRNVIARRNDEATPEICREHNLSESLLSRFSNQFAREAPQIFAQKSDGISAEAQRIAELERWENGYVESAIGHLKEEEVWQKEYESFEDAYTNLSYFLDVCYHHERILLVLHAIPCEGQTEGFPES